MSDPTTDDDPTGDDHLIQASDNSGEPGMPVENQDPDYIPEASVQ